MATTIAPPQENKAPPTRSDKHATTPEGFVSYIKEEFKRRMDERRHFESQWQLNQSFIDDNQWAEVHKVTGEVWVPDKRFAWEVRDNFNHVAPIYETRLAKLTRNRSIMTVVPGSSNQEDVGSAKISAKLCKFNQDEQNLDELIWEATAWSESCGTAFLKNIWNADKGQRIPNPSGGYVALGDVETVVCSPYEILPHNILKSRLEDQFSLMHVKAWPIDSDYVEMLVELAKKDGRDIRPTAEDVRSVTVGRSPVVNGGNPVTNFTTTALKNHLMVIEYYERPSRRYANGRFGIVLSNELVYLGDLPYEDGGTPDLPFVKIDSIKRHNRFWSKSVVERLLPIQRRYNILRSRVAEYLNRVGIGQWTSEEGTTTTDLTNEPGLHIEHTRGSKAPAPVQPPSLPGTFSEELANLKREFEDISGIHEVSQGRVPTGSNNPSGVMVAQLQEQDDTRIATTQRYLDKAIEKTGRQWLLRYKQFAVEKRMFQVVGKNNVVNTHYFDQTTIKSYNVKVQASSALANTPGARRDMVFSLADKGFFNDPETGRLGSTGIQRVFEMLELGNWEDFEEDQAVPTGRAQWENILMSKGQAVEVYPWEEHLIHLREINRFRQTDDFYQLLEGPNAQLIAQMFEEHAQKHKYYLSPPPPIPPVVPVPTGAAPPAPEAGVATTPGITTAPGTTPAEIARQAAQVQKQSGPGAAEAFVRQKLAEQQPKEPSPALY